MTSASAFTGGPNPEKHRVRQVLAEFQQEFRSAVHSPEWAMTPHDDEPDSSQYENLVYQAGLEIVRIRCGPAWIDFLPGNKSNAVYDWSDNADEVVRRVFGDISRRPSRAGVGEYVSALNKAMLAAETLVQDLLARRYAIQEAPQGPPGSLIQSLREIHDELVQISRRVG